MNKEILNILQQNARIDLKDLAVMVNLSVDEVKKEIEEMEKNKIICGYHALVNYDNTDDERVSALIEVKVTPQRGLGFDKIAERIYNFPEVSAVYLMSGAFDFTVMVCGTCHEQPDKANTRPMKITARAIFLIRHLQNPPFLTVLSKFI